MKKCRTIAGQQLHTTYQGENPSAASGPANHCTTNRAHHVNFTEQHPHAGFRSLDSILIGAKLNTF